MFCESCGKEIPDDSMFCEYCGRKVWEPAQSSFHEEEVCEGAEYNPHIEMEEEQVYESNHKREKSKFILIGVVAVISLAVIIVGYSILNKSLKNRPDKQDSASLDLQESKPADNGQVIPEKDIPSENLPELDSAEVDQAIPAVDELSKEPFADIGQEDFGWYFDLDFDQAPEGATLVEYNDVLGDWKIMAINYEAEFAETYYSFGNIKEYSSTENYTWANTIVTLDHKYIDYAGEKYPFDKEDATDQVLCGFDGDVLEMVFEDDMVVYVLFWEEKGKLYGAGHLFEDDDNDGFADLTLVLAFTR